MNVIDLTLERIPRPHPLQHYLAGHLTGAAAATSMLRGLAERLDADDLRRIVSELEDEQMRLRAVAQQMHMAPSQMTRAIAVTGEVLSRAARGAQGLYDERLRDLGELEAMITGINGKKALWRLLAKLEDTHPALAGLDYDKLLDAADRQQATVEVHRVARGVDALTDTVNSTGVDAEDRHAERAAN